MDCWAANIVAAITVLVILFDLVKEQWTNLPYHALGGLILSAIFWILCRFLGSEVSLSILVVPLLFLFVFGMGILFTTQSLKNQGCCVTCNTNGVETDMTSELSESSSSSSLSSSILTSLSGKPTDQCENDKRKLKANAIL